MHLWPFIPQREFTESLEWLTDVIRCKGGEQRFALRTVPRAGYLFNYLMDQRQFSLGKSYARAMTAEEVLLPLWGELTYLGGVAMGSVSLAFDTRFAHYALGGLIVVWDSEEHWEIREVATLTTGGLTFALPLEKNYVAALVAPLRAVRFAQPFEGSRGASDYLKASARFTTTEGVDLAGAIGTPLNLTNPAGSTGDTSGWTITDGAWIARTGVATPPSGGYHFFPGTSASAKMYQTVQPVSQGVPAATIDAGETSFQVVWEQGTFLGSAPYDEGRINLRFKTSGGTLLGSASSPLYAPTTATESSYAWETLEFSALMPAGTRKVEVELEAVRQQGTNNDGLFANIQTGYRRTYPVHRGHEVMTDRSFLISDIRERFEREAVEEDNTTGQVWIGPQFTYPIQTSSMNWDTLTREDLWNLRVWLHSRRGKWRGFWLPSWNPDLKVTQPIVATDTTITIREMGYPTFEGPRDLMVVTKAGAYHYLQVTGGTDGLLNQEVLALAGEAGVNLAVSDIEMVCFLTFMRFDADRIEIRHRAAKGASVAVPVMEAPVP